MLLVNAMSTSCEWPLKVAQILCVAFSVVQGDVLDLPATIEAYDLELDRLDLTKKTDRWFREETTWRSCERDASGGYFQDSLEKMKRNDSLLYAELAQWVDDAEKLVDRFKSTLSAADLKQALSKKKIHFLYGNVISEFLKEKDVKEARVFIEDLPDSGVEFLVQSRPRLSATVVKIVDEEWTKRGLATKFVKSWCQKVKQTARSGGNLWARGCHLAEQVALWVSRKLYVGPRKIDYKEWAYNADKFVPHMWHDIKTIENDLWRRVRNWQKRWQDFKRYVKTTIENELQLRAILSSGCTEELQQVLSTGMLVAILDIYSCWHSSFDARMAVFSSTQDAWGVLPNQSLEDIVEDLEEYGYTELVEKCVQSLALQKSDIVSPYMHEKFSDVRKQSHEMIFYGFLDIHRIFREVAYCI